MIPTSENYKGLHSSQVREGALFPEEITLFLKPRERRIRELQWNYSSPQVLLSLVNIRTIYHKSSPQSLPHVCIPRGWSKIHKTIKKNHMEEERIHFVLGHCSTLSMSSLCNLSIFEQSAPPPRVHPGEVELVGVCEERPHG